MWWSFLTLIFSYNICVRKEAGYCCIQYSACSDTGSWSISQIASTAATDTVCTADYVTITGASAACGPTTQAVQPVQKICGGIFSGVDTQTINAPVCGKYNLTFYFEIYVLFFSGN